MLDCVLNQCINQKAIEIIDKTNWQIIDKEID